MSSPVPPVIRSLAVSRSALQPVIAGPAVQLIEAFALVDLVVAAMPEQEVVAAEAEDLIGILGAVQRVGTLHPR